MTPDQVGQPITIRYSHYWPPLGPPNCAVFIDGRCISKTASGEPWERWVGRGVACPPEWPFGTQLLAFGQTWTCVDRGSKVTDNWVDFLVPEPHLAYGSLVEVKVIWSEGE